MRDPRIQTLSSMHDSVMPFSRVLYGPEVADETSDWAPSWWRKALNECTWPEVNNIFLGIFCFHSQFSSRCDLLAMYFTCCIHDCSFRLKAAVHFFCTINRTLYCRFCACTYNDKLTTFLHRILDCKCTSLKTNCLKSFKTWHRIRLLTILALLQDVYASFCTLSYAPEVLVLFLFKNGMNPHHLRHLNALVCQGTAEAVLRIAAGGRKTCPAYLPGSTLEWW